MFLNAKNVKARELFFKHAIIPALRQSESLNVVCMPNLFLFLSLFSFLYEMVFLN